MQDVRGSDSVAADPDGIGGNQQDGASRVLRASARALWLP